MFFCSMTSLTSPSISAAIARKSFSVSWLKHTTSSTRLRNSGLRKSLRAFIVRSRFMSLKEPPKPTLPDLVLLPALVVMMMIVFSKFTVRPCASVMRPSSRIWSRMFITSGCAFSISSKSTTLYGLRRIFSVSCPASS